MSPSNALYQASIHHNKKINALNDEMKLMEYKIKRITSSGIEAYPVLKISQISVGAEDKEDKLESGRGSPTKLKEPSFFKNENVLDIIEDNPLNCVLYAGDKIGKVKIAI